MKIWRIQNKDGIGPYSVATTEKSPAVNEMQNNHNMKLDVYPSTYSDIGIKRCPSKRELHGFINESQMRNWFSEDDFQVLSEDGFEVVVMDGEITAVGRNQVLFHV